jgi:hypothetical protein
MQQIYLPIVFWLGVAMTLLSIVFTDRTWAIGGVLLMTWGLALALIGHWAQRRRERMRARRSEF